MMDVDGGRGHSMTLPKGAKADCVRVVVSIRRFVDGIEGIMVVYLKSHQ